MMTINLIIRQILAHAADQAVMKMMITMAVAAHAAAQAAEGAAKVADGLVILKAMPVLDPCPMVVEAEAMKMMKKITVMRMIMKVLIVLPAVVALAEVRAAQAAEDKVVPEEVEDGSVTMKAMPVPAPCPMVVEAEAMRMMKRITVMRMIMKVLIALQDAALAEVQAAQAEGDKEVQAKAEDGLVILKAMQELALCLTVHAPEAMKMMKMIMITVAAEDAHLIAVADLAVEDKNKKREEKEKESQNFDSPFLFLNFIFKNYASAFF
jgi:hypothetical protein